MDTDQPGKVAALVAARIKENPVAAEVACAELRAGLANRLATIHPETQRSRIQRVGPRRRPASPEPARGAPPAA